MSEYYVDNAIKLLDYTLRINNYELFELTCLEINSLLEDLLRDDFKIDDNLKGDLIERLHISYCFCIETEFKNVNSILNEKHIIFIHMRVILDSLENKIPYINRIISQVYDLYYLGIKHNKIKLFTLIYDIRHAINHSIAEINKTFWAKVFLEFNINFMIKIKELLDENRV